MHESRKLDPMIFGQPAPYNSTMNAFIRPFTALRPKAAHAADVAAPPYDVVNTEEARGLVAHRPNSFLHISRPEIALPPETDPYSDIVHARARENFERLKASGLMVRDAMPAYYVYKLKMAQHEQTGIALTASIDAYKTNRVRKHELSHPTKEDDRVRNMQSLNAQTGPVLSIHQANKSLKELLEEIKTEAALFEVKGEYDVVHTIWRIEDIKKISAISFTFNAMQAIYIADGHHRSAAAARVADMRRTPESSGQENYNYFLTVVFPHDEVQIFDYNRAVKDLNGLSVPELLQRLAKDFDVKASNSPVRPEEPAVFGMFVDNQWYRLMLRTELVPKNDLVAQLDVSLLQDCILTKILDVGDPRTDPRIDFIGGVRGLKELEQLVRKGEQAIAFSLYPTRMEQLMTVADAEELMPPKSTWFEPKLADGLLSHILD